MSQNTSTAQASGIRGILTLLYTGAVLSVITAVFAIVAVAGKLFSLWTGSNIELQNVISFFAATGNPYLETILLAVTAAGASVAAFFLYRAVSRNIAQQHDYATTTAYTFLTNTLVGLLAVVLAVFSFQAVTVLLSSLLLIGTGTDIGGLYLGFFLPLVIVSGITGFVGYLAFEIMRGRNKSALMTLVLMSVAGAALVAALITVPIKAHGGSSSRSSSSSSSYRDLLDRYRY